MADLEIGRESKILSSSTASRPSKVIKYRGLRTAHQGQEEVRERPKERPVSAGPGRDKGCTTSGPGDLELLGSWIWKTTSVSREGEWHLVSLCALNRVFQQSKCAYNARATGGQTPAQLDCRQPHIDCSQEGCARLAAPDSDGFMPTSGRNLWKSRRIAQASQASLLKPRPIRHELLLPLSSAFVPPYPGTTFLWSEDSLPAISSDLETTELWGYVQQESVQDTTGHESFVKH